MRYIDKNVILRFLVDKKEDQQEGLKSLFLKMEKGEIKVECFEMIFFQVIFVLKSFYKVEKENIIENMKKVLLLKGFHMKNKRIVERTLELWNSHSDDVIDCYIVAHMEYYGGKELFSYDKKIEKLGIKRIDP